MEVKENRSVTEGYCGFNNIHRFKIKYSRKVINLIIVCGYSLFDKFLVNVGVVTRHPYYPRRRINWQISSRFENPEAREL